MALDRYVRVVEHSQTDYRVVRRRDGVELRRYTPRDHAEAYARGWNQVAARLEQPA